MSNGEYRAVTAAAGEMYCWWVEPAGDTAGTVIVLQEAFGLTDHIRDIADRLGAAGYRAVAPDLYYRWGDRRTFSVEKINDALACYSKLSMELFCADFECVLDAVGRDGSVATIGFCMGGLLSWVAACEYGDLLGCAVSFYGGGIGSQLQRCQRLTVPLQLNFAEKDDFVPLEEVERVRTALAECAATFELHLYPGAGHGFMCPDRESFNQQAATLGWDRALDFLQEWLRGAH